MYYVYYPEVYSPDIYIAIVMKKGSKHNGLVFANLHIMQHAYV